MDHIYFAEGSKMMDGLGEGRWEGVDETQTSKTIGESHWDALLEFFQPNYIFYIWKFSLYG